MGMERDQIRPFVERIACKASTVGGVRLPPASSSTDGSAESGAGMDSILTGDRFPVPQGRWVDVANLDPLMQLQSTGIKELRFREEDELPDSCRIESGGSVEVLGFSDDGVSALVRYTGTQVEGAVHGTRAPDGTLFVIDTLTLPQWFRSHKLLKAKRLEMRRQVEDILDGATCLREAGHFCMRRQRGDVLRFESSMEQPSVVAMNLDPILHCVRNGLALLFRQLSDHDRERTFGPGASKPPAFIERQLAFSDAGEWQECDVLNGGRVRVLGFTDDARMALVEYLGGPPFAAVESHMTAEQYEGIPVGVQFFVPLRRRDEWPGEWDAVMIADHEQKIGEEWERRRTPRTHTLCAMTKLRQTK